MSGTRRGRRWLARIEWVSVMTPTHSLNCYRDDIASIVTILERCAVGIGVADVMQRGYSQPLFQLRQVQAAGRHVRSERLVDAVRQDGAVTAGCIIRVHGA